MVYPGIQGALPAAGEQIILAVRLPANSNIHTTVNASSKRMRLMTFVVWTVALEGCLRHFAKRL
jgi:hypothetical protein